MPCVSVTPRWICPRIEHLELEIGKDPMLLSPDGGLPTKRVLLKLEQIRQKIEDAVTRQGELSASFTISAGISTFPIHGQSVDGLLQLADEALYKAKQSGRNTIAIAGLAT